MWILNKPVMLVIHDIGSLVDWPFTASLSSLFGGNFNPRVIPSYPF